MESLHTTISTIPAPFAGESDLVRRQGIQNQTMVAWALHEVVAAMVRAVDGNFDPASGRTAQLG